MNIYECSFCHKTFKNSKSLGKHEIHIHQRPHQDRKGIKLSEEHKEKIRAALMGNKNGVGSKGNIGKITSDETKRKLSELNSGEKNHFYGKTHTDDVRKRISIARSGKSLSKEHKEKISKGIRQSIEEGHFFPVNNNKHYNKGKFKPKNPSRYAGDPTRICFRSSWELKMMLHLDSNPNVVKWQSEEISLGYLDKATGRVRRYFPDFVITFKHEDGSLKTVMAEIKPFSQAIPPKKKKRITPKSEQVYINEVNRYATNVSKWEAAKLYCEKKGWEFKILTENEIFFKPKEL